MDEKQAVRALAALGQSVRLKVFRALVVAGESGLTPGTISDALGIPAATLSFHLKELAGAGLARQERASRHRIYRADYEAMNALLLYLTDHCCEGTVCIDVPVVTCDTGRTMVEDD